MYDFNMICEINEICRSRVQKPVGFIYAASLGLYNIEFADFGKDFKVYDRDGEEIYPYLIDNISKSDPGFVTIHKDKPHNFQTGDFVCINQVEGMKEVNGPEARPIKKIDEFSFTIEDTSDF